MSAWREASKTDVVEPPRIGPAMTHALKAVAKVSARPPGYFGPRGKRQENVQMSTLKRLATHGLVVVDQNIYGELMSAKLTEKGRALLAVWDLRDAANDEKRAAAARTFFLGTQSGRTSSSKPNLQGLPRRGT